MELELKYFVIKLTKKFDLEQLKIELGAIDGKWIDGKLLAEIILDCEL